jgi:hypothetical protein
VAVVSFKGMDKLVRAFNKFPNATSKELRVEMKTQLTAIQKEAKDNPGYTPRSGNLGRLTISPDIMTVSNSGLIGRIRLRNNAQVPYAIIQHEGGKAGRKHSVNIKPQKFLRRAFDKRKKEAVTALRGAIGRAIKSAGLK